jgi:hypothetical protein
MFTPTADARVEDALVEDVRVRDIRVADVRVQYMDLNEAVMDKNEAATDLKEAVMTGPVVTITIITKLSKITGSRQKVWRRLPF